jgi:hypothetical protein
MLITVGVLRASSLPPSPFAVRRPSVQPSFGSWHVAQLMSLLRESRVSKNSSVPSSTRLASSVGWVGANATSVGDAPEP